MQTWADQQRHLPRDELAVVQDNAIRSLSGFVRDAWHVLEPGVELEWAPYLDALCAELEAIYRGECRDLTISIPPGMMKSLLVSVFFPSWWWLHKPGERFLSLANASKVAIRDSRRMRDVVTSDWYRALVERQDALGRVPSWGLARDQNEKINFETAAKGFRQCYAIGDDITGMRGSVILIDDPHDVKDVAIGSPEQVRKRLADVATVIDQVLPTRVTDRRTARWITIMQRLHDDDTAGRRIGRGRTRPVVLPMRYDPDHPEVYELDPRTERGELLHPERMPEDEVAKLEDELGDQAPGQLQQRPVRSEGGLFKPAWFAERYELKPKAWRKRANRVVVSVDAAFKDTKKSDFVAIGAWAVIWPDVYLLDVIRERMDYPTTREVLRDFVEQWRATEVVIEEKANGAALIAELGEHVPGVVPYVPTDSKYARAQTGAVYFKAGNVKLPPTKWAPWMPDFRREHLSFPLGANDDQVDMASQLLIHLFVEEGGEDDAFLLVG